MVGQLVLILGIFASFVHCRYVVNPRVLRRHGVRSDVYIVSNKANIRIHHDGDRWVRRKSRPLDIRPLLSFDGDVDITKAALPEKNNDKTNGSQHADIKVIPGIDGNNPDIIIRDNLPSPGIDIQKETTTTNITPQNSVISLDSAYQSVGQTVRREAVSLNMKAENGVQGKLEVNGNAVLEGNVGQANNQQGNVEQSLTQQHGNDVPASGGDGQEEIGGAKPADIQHSGELGQGSLTGSEVNGRKQAAIVQQPDSVDLQNRLEQGDVAVTRKVKTLDNLQTNGLSIQGTTKKQSRNAPYVTNAATDNGVNSNGGIDVVIKGEGQMDTKVPTPATGIQDQGMNVYGEAGPIDQSVILSEQTVGGLDGRVEFIGQATAKVDRENNGANEFGVNQDNQEEQELASSGGPMTDVQSRGAATLDHSGEVGDNGNAPAGKNGVNQNIPAGVVQPQDGQGGEFLLDKTEKKAPQENKIRDDLKKLLREIEGNGHVQSEQNGKEEGQTLTDSAAEALDGDFRGEKEAIVLDIRSLDTTYMKENGGDENQPKLSETEVEDDRTGHGFFVMRGGRKGKSSSQREIGEYESDLKGGRKERRRHNKRKASFFDGSDWWGSDSWDFDNWNSDSWESDHKTYPRTQKDNKGNIIVEVRKPVYSKKPVERKSLWYYKDSSDDWVDDSSDEHERESNHKNKKRRNNLVSDSSDQSTEEYRNTGSGSQSYEYEYEFDSESDSGYKTRRSENTATEIEKKNRYSDYEWESDESSEWYDSDSEYLEETKELKSGKRDNPYKVSVPENSDSSDVSSSRDASEKHGHIFIRNRIKHISNSNIPKYHEKDAKSENRYFKSRFEKSSSENGVSNEFESDSWEDDDSWEYVDSSDEEYKSQKRDSELFSAIRKPTFQESLVRVEKRRYRGDDSDVIGDEKRAKLIKKPNLSKEAKSILYRVVGRVMLHKQGRRLRDVDSSDSDFSEIYIRPKLRFRKRRQGVEGTVASVTSTITPVTSSVK